LLAAHLCPAQSRAGSLRRRPVDSQVPQCSRRLLALALQRIRRILIPSVALLHFSSLGLEEAALVSLLSHRSMQLGHERAITFQPAGLQQGSFHGDVGGGFAATVFDGAYAVA